jgi:hypothetical protein
MQSAEGLRFPRELRPMGTFYVPQGGCDSFLSRRAVELLSPLAEEIVKYMTGSEDILMGTFLERRMNLPLALMTTGAIIGYFFHHKSLQKIKERRLNKLPPCPRTENQSMKFCRPFLTPLRDIVLYHDWPTHFPRDFENSVAVFNAPSNINWFMASLIPTVCRLPSSQLGHVSKLNFGKVRT